MSKSMSKPMSKSAVVVVALVCAVALAACSSSKKKTSSGTSGGPKVTDIKVGTSPALSNVTLYLAASAGGSFSKHNLKETPQVVTSGAQALPLLLNGQLQFTASDPLGTMLAIKKGIPLVIVASGNTAGTDVAHDNTGLIVKSNTTAVADLAGKTVGVNALNGLANISAKAAIDAKGGDSSKVKFVEVPIPQMQSAVKAGTVDGAVTTEPFLTAAKQAGLSDILPIFSNSVSRVPQIVYITSKSYLKSHPDVVKAFADSITESNAAVTKDPSKIKAVALTSTTVPAAVLDKIILPIFDPPTVQVPILKQLLDLAVKYGAFSDKSFDPTPYVYTG